MLNCTIYDYVEIACLYNMPIRLSMVDASENTGTAIATRINYKRKECIELLQDNNESILVELDNVLLITVSLPNVHFQQVNFKTQQVIKEPV